ncbi:MAG: hypothetical protein ACRD02_06065 [Acidimicrobiia bacterium]
MICELAGLGLIVAAAWTWLGLSAGLLVAGLSLLVVGNSSR